MFFRDETVACCLFVYPTSRSSDDGQSNHLYCFSLYLVVLKIWICGWVNVGLCCSFKNLETRQLPHACLFVLRRGHPMTANPINYLVFPYVLLFQIYGSVAEYMFVFVVPFKFVWCFIDTVCLFVLRRGHPMTANPINYLPSLLIILI